MPSGAKKRKAAKKKKVNDSSRAHSHQGENDASRDQQNTQDPSVEVEKREDNSSENKSISIEKDLNVGEGKTEIEIGSKSKNSHGSSSSSSSSSSDDESHVVDKKVVVLESVPAIESVPVLESLSEKITHKDEELEISPIVDPVKPVGTVLEEASQVFDETKNENEDLAVEEQTVVVSETALKDDSQTSNVVVESVSKENGVVKLDEKGSSESKDYAAASSTYVQGSISEVNAADLANKKDTIGQPGAASTPLSVQKTTSWKSCCGIFELFSGSER